MSDDLRARMEIDYADGTPTTPEQCRRCTHWRGDATCDAFPGLVPVPILTNRWDHRRPYPGDGGIRFEPVSDEAAREVADLFRERT